MLHSSRVLFSNWSFSILLIYLFSTICCKGSALILWLTHYLVGDSFWIQKNKVNNFQWTVDPIFFHSQLKIVPTYIFGLCEVAGVPRDNPCKHKESTQTPHRKHPKDLNGNHFIIVPPAFWFDFKKQQQQKHPSPIVDFHKPGPKMYHWLKKRLCYNWPKWNFLTLFHKIEEKKSFVRNILPTKNTLLIALTL